MSSQLHIILGFPNSGKTTYLAALWHVIDAGLTELALDKITGDTTYLNEIMQLWLKCMQVPRTSITSEEMVDMTVRNRQSKELMVLSLPDFSGEKFQEIFAERECEESFPLRFEEANGILFFVNADRANDNMSIVDHIYDEDPDEESVDNSVPEDFDARKAPEQTKIVEMLQLLQSPLFFPKRRRLVIVVSAWDVIISDEITPSDWVMREMPLLYQFIQNNSSFFDVRFCGISAQGGEFSDSTRANLLVKTPAERVICDWGGSVSTDITKPLIWLSGDD